MSLAPDPPESSFGRLVNHRDEDGDMKSLARHDDMRSLARHEDSEIRSPVKQEGFDVRSLLRPPYRHRPSTAPSQLRNLEMAPEDPSDVQGAVTTERQQRLPVDLELGRDEDQHQKYFSLAPHKRDHRLGGHTRRHAGHHGHVSLGNVFREPGEEDLVRNVEISR